MNREVFIFPDGTFGVCYKAVNGYIPMPKSWPGPQSLMKYTTWAPDPIHERIRSLLLRHRC
jgi:hypothetical protein